MEGNRNEKSYIREIIGPSTGGKGYWENDGRADGVQKYDAERTQQTTATSTFYMSRAQPFVERVRKTAQ